MKLVVKPEGQSGGGGDGDGDGDGGGDGDCCDDVQDRIFSFLLDILISYLCEEDDTTHNRIIHVSKRSALILLLLKRSQ